VEHPPDEIVALLQAGHSVLLASNRDELRNSMWDELGLALEPPAGSA
jgi:hypothetical protein